MPVVLDLRPSATAKPRSAKISVSSSITWLTGWTEPLGLRAGSDRSSRSVASRRSSSAFSSACLARRDRRVTCLAQRVDLRRFGGARVGVHRAQRLEQRRDLARLAERRDAHRVERGEVGGGGDFARETSLERVDGHAALG